ncbi:MAG TPA: thioredoxin family protein [Xylella taiwanensis]
MQIITATSPDEFNAVLKAHSRLLVDFYKDHCPGCRMLDMALDKFAATEAAVGVVVLKIRLETIGEDFFRGLGLRQTPTLGVFSNGFEVSRLLGFQSLAQIEAAVQTYL